MGTYFRFTKYGIPSGPYVEYRNPGHLTKQINWISLTTRLNVTLTKQRISMLEGGHLNPYPYLTFFIEICLILWRLLIPKLKDLESSASVLRCLWKFLLGKLFFRWHHFIEILLWKKKKSGLTVKFLWEIQINIFRGQIRFMSEHNVDTQQRGRLKDCM